MELKIDIDIYPPFISQAWICKQYNLSRPTVNDWIVRGILPPFSTPVGSSKPGWTREYFVSFLMSKGEAEGKLAADSGIFAKQNLN